jgi:hypothetical protein
MHATAPLPAVAPLSAAEEGVEEEGARGGTVSAIKPDEGFGDVDHTIKELMSL